MGRVVIVVPEGDYERFRARIGDLCSTSWEEHVRLIPGSVRRSPVAHHARKQTDCILQEVEAFKATHLIVPKEIYHDAAEFKLLNDVSYVHTQLKAMDRSVLLRVLREAGVTWRDKVTQVLRHWQHSSADLDRWLEQFNRLGHRWIGESILRQLRIISSSQLSEALSVTPQDLIGTPIKLTYVDEDDVASSGHVIGAMLKKKYTYNIMDLRSAIEGAADGDQICLFEDGLWTGVEFRQQLDSLLGQRELGKQILKPLSDPQKLRRVRVLVRHGVVTDFGLLVVRRYLRIQNLQGIQLASSKEQQLLRVLPDDAEKRIDPGGSLTTDDFERALKTLVIPAAFNDDVQWAGRKDEAIEFCRVLGRQLIQEYATAHHKNWGYEIIEQFSLGGYGFASVIMFAHSIPKSCLPVLWCSGPVKYGSTTIPWTPLIRDARYATWREN